MEDIDLENDVENMEKSIMASMRKRTMSRVHTWDARLERKQELAHDKDNDFGAFKTPTRRFTEFLAVAQS